MLIGHGYRISKHRTPLEYGKVVIGSRQKDECALQRFKQLKSVIRERMD
jgi:hypothetical protein